MLKKLLFIFALIFCIAGAAHATQLTMGDNSSTNPDSYGLGGLYVDVVLNDYEYHYTTGAGEFNIVIDGYETYGYCVDFAADISGRLGTTYEIADTTDPAYYTDGYFTVGTAAYAAWLMDTYSVGLGYDGYTSLVANSTADEAAAALQIAIWYALYNYDSNSATSFSFISDGSGSQNRINSLLTAYLNGLPVTDLSTLTTSNQFVILELYAYDENGNIIDKQDLITTAPVPEPATMLLLGSGLLGMTGIVSRRNRAGKRQA